MVKKSDNNVDKISGPWALIAFLFKYRAKELLASLFLIAVILNLSDVKIADIIKKILGLIF